MNSSITISTNKSLLNVNFIHNYLSNQSYWAKGRTLVQVKKTIESCLCFGVYEHKEQIGFARVLTDYVAFGYFMDVFVIDSHQHKGIGNLLLKSIMAHPELTGVQRLMLATQDAHTFYKKFGFDNLENPKILMDIKRY